jgi:hypothetical protein
MNERGNERITLMLSFFPILFFSDESMITMDLARKCLLESQRKTFALPQVNVERTELDQDDPWIRGRKTTRAYTTRITAGANSAFGGGLRPGN